MLISEIIHPAVDHRTRFDKKVVAEVLEGFLDVVVDEFGHVSKE